MSKKVKGRKPATENPPAAVAPNADFLKAFALARQPRPLQLQPAKPAEMSLDDHFAKAFDLAQDMHQAGNLAEAEASYRQILQRRPDHAGALHYLGAIALQARRLDEACELMDKALESTPDDPRLLTNLGYANMVKGAYPRAERLLRKARRLDANLVNADSHLAQVLALQGDYAEAIKVYESVVGNEAGAQGAGEGNFSALFEMAQCYIMTGRKADAMEALERAMAQAPGSIEIPRLLGNLYRDQRKFPQALDTLLKALNLVSTDRDTLIALARTFIDIKDTDSGEKVLHIGLETYPEDWEFHNWLAVMLCPIPHRVEEALQCALRAAELAPGREETLVSVSNCYQMLEKYDEAGEWLQRCLTYHPKSAVALSNLGTLYWVQGDREKGMDYNSRALAADPSYPAALFNHSLFHMIRGELDEAWRLFDYGLFTGQRAPAFVIFTPLWLPDEDLSDKTLLVRREQGIGDELLYASMYPDLVARAKHCIFECHPKLEPLLARSFPTATVMDYAKLRERTDILATADRQIMAGSLMARLRPTIESFPAPNAYLRADPERVRLFRQRLDALPGRVKIAVGWRSKQMDLTRVKFYMRLEDMAAILNMPDTCFVSVQYDGSADHIKQEIERARQSHGINVHVFDDLDTLDDIDGVAALIEACDLVVGAPTTVARISGSLGKTTFEATPVYIEQHIGQAVSPFTPAVKIIQPPTAYDRATMLKMLEEEVAAFVASH